MYLNLQDCMDCEVLVKWFYLLKFFIGLMLNCFLTDWLRGAFFGRVFQNSRLVSLSLASSWARFKMSDILEKMFWLRIWLFTWQRIDNLMLGIFHRIFRIYCCTGCVPPLGTVRAANWGNTYNILLIRVQDCVFLDFKLKLSSERLVCNFSILSSSFLFLLILFPLFPLTTSSASKAGS